MQRNWNRLLVVLLMAGLLVSLLQALNGASDEPTLPEGDEGATASDASVEPPLDVVDLPTFSLVMQGDEPYFTLSTWRELVEPLGWSVTWSEVDRHLAMEREGGHYIAATFGVPVIEHDGQFRPLAEPVTLGSGGEPLVRLALFEEVFGTSAVVAVSQAEEGITAEIDIDAAAEAMVAWRPWVPPVFDGDGLVQRLAFLQHPLRGAGVNIADTHVVGAPRPYRYGVHEGFDFYDYRIGIPITLDTPVHSMADGVIIRIDHGWQMPSTSERSVWLRESEAARRTPEWLLDRFRGRQVWVLHGDGVMARYAHLSSVRDDLQVGDTVSAGEILGTVGSSGTSGEPTGTGLHLHLDILLDGQVPWDQFTPSEQRALLAAIFG